MNRIHQFSIIAAVVLVATSAAAHAQHVRGGMGEDITIGSGFGGYSGKLASGAALLDGNGRHAADRDKGHARAQDRHTMHTTGPQAKAHSQRGRY